jgi:hypothetical protein
LRQSPGWQNEGFLAFGRKDEGAVEADLDASSGDNFYKDSDVHYTPCICPLRIKCITSHPRKCRHGFWKEKKAEQEERLHAHGLSTRVFAIHPYALVNIFACGVMSQRMMHTRKHYLGNVASMVVRPKSQVARVYSICGVGPFFLISTTWSQLAHRSEE